MQLDTAIPAIVTLETPLDLGPVLAGHDAPLARGFQGVIRSVNRKKLILDADARSEKIDEKAKDGLFLTVPMADRSNHLTLKARIVWVKDYSQDKPGKRCSVCLELTSPADQLVALDEIISDMQLKKMFYKEFAVERTVYFGDTNVEGNVYFAKFFEWQGAAREEFYLAVMPDALGFLKSGTRIITAEARVQFKSQFVLFDRIIVEVKISSIKTASIDFLFVYRKRNSGELAAIGSQILAFTNENGQVIQVPEEVVCSIQPYLSPYCLHRTYL